MSERKGSASSESTMSPAPGESRESLANTPSSDHDDSAASASIDSFTGDILQEEKMHATESINAVPLSGDPIVKSEQGDCISVIHRERSHSASSNGRQAYERKPGKPWNETILRFAPLSGILGLCIALASIVAAVGVLAGSNGQLVEEWKLEPSTYLAIFTAIANQSVRYATAQGVAIAWWYRASRSTSLSQLHHDWRSGTTIRGALTAGRHLGLLGLACVCSTLVAVDGPLLQKATSVVSSSLANQAVLLNVTIAPEVPTGWSGGWIREPGAQSTDIFNRTILTSTGKRLPNDVATFGLENTEKMIDLQSGVLPMVGVVQGCPNTCNSKIRAPALALTSCLTKMISVNYTMSGPTKAQQQNDLVLESLAFDIEIDLLLEEGHESLNLVTAYHADDACAGELNLTICTLLSAVGEYNVLISDDVITLENGLPTIIAIANNTRINNTFDPLQQFHDSTLAGVENVASYILGSIVSMFTKDGIVHVVPDGNGVVAAESILPDVNNTSCPPFRDPHYDTLVQLNTLMFAAGILAARESDPSGVEVNARRMDPGLSMRTVTEGYLQGPRNVYRTDFAWFVAAALVELICISLVLPTYWGWWTLGRTMSFSPLEIAKAFEAPMLADFNSSSTGADIAASTDNISVQYGALRSGQSRLAFAAPEAVSHPQNNTTFDV